MNIGIGEEITFEQLKKWSNKCDIYERWIKTEDIYDNSEPYMLERKCDGKTKSDLIDGEWK